MLEPGICIGSVRQRSDLQQKNHHKPGDENAADLPQNKFQVRPSCQPPPGGDMRAIVTQVHVVAQRELDRRWANEYRIETIYRTGGVTQQAIDAHAELLVAIELVRSLEVFALGNWFFISANEPRLDALQLAHEV